MQSDIVYAAHTALNNKGGAVLLPIGPHPKVEPSHISQLVNTFT